MFCNKYCDVIYKGKVILQVQKDPLTDLWMLPINGSCVTNQPDIKEQTDEVINVAGFTHSVRNRANAVKFAHQLPVAV